MTRHRLLHVAVCAVFCLGAAGIAVFDGSGPPNDIGALAAGPSGEGTPASTMLDGLNSAERANARIEVELFGTESASDRAAARSAEQLWAAGRHSAAIATIRQLEHTIGVGIGIAWKVPVAPESPDFVDDVRVGNRVDATMVALDYDASTGHLFAVVHWDEATPILTVYISTDGGATWWETFIYGPSAGADGVVAGDWFWVGYQAATYPAVGRLRRFSLADGSYDSVYGNYAVVVLTSANIAEIVLFSNADENDTRIYYSFIASDGTMRVFWDDSSSGTTFAESTTPSPITNAASGLDWHWNANSALLRYAWTSFLGNDGDLHVWRWDPEGWNEMDTYSSYDGNNAKTKISAWGDNVIYAFEDFDDPHWWVIYRMSFDGGQSWTDGAIAPYDNCFDFDVTARSGVGTAAIYGREVGEPDRVAFRARAGFAPGSWSAPLRFNEHDISTGSTDMEINWLGNAHGALYVDEFGAVWFDRTDSIFKDGFESGATGAWSAAVP